MIPRSTAIALKAVEDLGDEYKQLTARLEEVKRDLVPLIIKAFEAGAEPCEVNAVSPFSHVYNRLLAKAHGIPRGRPGRKPWR